MEKCGSAPPERVVQRPGSVKSRWVWAVGGAIVAMVVVGNLTGPASSDAPAAIGTAGRDDPEALDDVSPSTIHDVETITGAIDGHELIGRRVDLHAKAVGVTNKGAFWVGARDNHVLVAPARDQPIARRPVREGQAVRISGIIQEVPKAKERLSWDLTAPDLLQLTDQRIYIRADRLRPE